MKRIKKIASLVLAMVMVLAMSVPVFAADNHPHKITVTQNTDDKTEHTYEAYQIFAGDLAEVDGNKVLSNIIWGSGVNDVELLSALKSEAAFKGAFDKCETAAAVAQVLAGDAFKNSDVEDSTLTDTFARIVENNLAAPAVEAKGIGDVTINVTGSGYYLVKDKDGSVSSTPDENGNYGAYSRFMLEVVGDATATVKSEVPHGDKKVYVDGDTTGDANNASIGSHVSYEITSEVPNHVGYNYYYFIMNDTLSAGLTLDYNQGENVPNEEKVDSFTVKVGETKLNRGTDYFVYTGNDVAPKTFRLAFANIMNYPVGTPIVITYSATINDHAVVGNTGNPNTWTLQYSNNPDDTFDGDRPDGETTPGLPADEENESLGETPEEKTLTYVTELDITKYANSIAEDHLLAGAEFTLTGTSKQVVLSTVDYYEASADGTYYLLLDGTYTETAPTGTEYVEIGVGTKETTTGYIKDGDNYIVPTDKTQYDGKTLYKLVKGTASTYADVNTKYKKTSVTETEYKNALVSIEMTTGSDGKISFKDLGAGEYTLTETITPAGFNTLDPITFTIGFEGPEKVSSGTEPCEWTITGWPKAADGTEGVTNTNGIFAANVINQSGSLLPSTGGIGTTIFYVLGGILVVGACVLLVVRKRMSKSE